MEWVIVAIVVVALLVTIGISGRQRAAVRAQQEQLRRLESKLDAMTGGQQPAQDQQSSPYHQPQSFQPTPYQPTPYQQPTYQQPTTSGYPPPSYPAAYADPGLDPRLDEVRRLVREGRKIEAIKVYREVTRVGLREAKDAVERMIV
jgi:hypothetical protein